MDATQFKRLFLPLHAVLYRTAYGILHNEDDAKDIVQDTFLKLWNKRGNLVNIKNQEAYCVTLIKHQCIDFLRSQKKNSNITPEELEKVDQLSVSKEVEIKDSAMHMQHLISKLPERQQQIITLREIKQMSITEISEVTQLSNINIRATLSKARQTLRNRFIQVMHYGYKEN